MLFMRALFAFLVLPGTGALLVPPLAARLDPYAGDRFSPGLAVVLMGVLLLLWCVIDFYRAGKGTLAPWDPPQRLVTIGLYRFVRNPMYVAALCLTTGWTLYFRSPLVCGYTLALGLAFHLRVVLYEEPWLGKQHGAQWTEYQRLAPRWIPRLPKK